MSHLASFGSSLLRAVPKHPVLVICGVIAIAFLSLARIVDLQTGAPRLLIDPSIDSLLPVGDENRAYFEGFKETFATGDKILIALEDEDIFTAPNLGRIQRISEGVEALPGVDRVSSLSSSINIRSEGGALVVENFYEEVPEDGNALADLRNRALADPIYAGNLVSKNGRTSMIIVHLLDISDLELQSSGIDESVRAIAAAEWSHAPFRMTGMAHIKTQLNEVIISDMTVIVPITWILMAIVTYIAFRSISAVVVTLLSIQLSTLITVGFIAYQFETLNQITSAVPSILFVIGLAAAIHVLSAYFDALREFGGRGDSEANAVLRALSKVALPVVFTGLTTAAGFLSLRTSPLEAIQQYGVSTAVGVLITTLVSLTFAPALLQLLPTPNSVRTRQADDRFKDALIRLAHFDMRHRDTILAIGLVVALVSFAGIFKIQVGYDFASSFKANHPVRLDFEATNALLEGANGFHIALETSAGEGFKEPENLAELDALQSWLVAQPEVGGTTSFADYVKALYQGVEGGDSLYFRIPDSPELVSQLLVIGENEEIDQFVDFDFQTANIAVRTTAMNSKDVLPLVERIEARLREIPPHIRARVTGGSVLISRTMDDMAYGQATSMVTAFGSIFVILAILFTSFRVALIALVPNALPVLMYFGILGWAGVELNTVTAMVACVVLGIAVDDTIHLLSHFNREAKSRADVERGVTHALVSVGRPVTYTTIALCLGFLCLMFSDMRTQFEFGWLATTTLAGAWLVDMTFTPALAARLRIVTIWDVISLDLGEAPQRSIPLFEGLTTSQAKIAACMGSIARFGANDRVFSNSEPGDYLYIVIDGRLKVSVQSNGSEVVLTELARGAVLGEIALFHGVRSADVDAITDARMLRLDNDDLHHIRRRRPKIGAQLYANLSRAQAERIVDLTNRVR